MPRPRKPDDERYVVKNIRFPPALWAELADEVPPGERSAFIHREISRALQRRRRQKAKKAAASRPQEVTSVNESIWDKIDGLIQQVPEEEFARLPEDGSEQHDHYIYGVPKRPR
jgi:hypothetical protein